MAHILVLDDIAEAGVMIQKILGKKGHKVVIFTDEDQALEHARKHRIDLAILDIMLKKCSGLDVLVQLHEIDPAIRALMLTGYPTMETLRQAMELGAKEYCVKPIDKHELEEKVSAVLGS